MICVVSSTMSYAAVMLMLLWNCYVAFYDLKLVLIALRDVKCFMLRNPVQAYWNLFQLKLERAEALLAETLVWTMRYTATYIIRLQDNVVLGARKI